MMRVDVREQGSEQGSGQGSGIFEESIKIIISDQPRQFSGRQDEERGLRGKSAQEWN